MHEFNSPKWISLGNIISFFVAERWLLRLKSYTFCCKEKFESVLAVELPLKQKSASEYVQTLTWAGTKFSMHKGISRKVKNRASQIRPTPGITKIPAWVERVHLHFNVRFILRSNSRVSRIMSMPNFATPLREH